MSAQFSTSILLLVKLRRSLEKPYSSLCPKPLFPWLKPTGLPSDLALPMHIRELCRPVMPKGKSSLPTLRLTILGSIGVLRHFYLLRVPDVRC
ncbi:hypothetical protein PIIN_11184 [Serendipita indica DSM 11827]|uniref:Uncharacterized protein n=1 Tax=Serendipita indica (strain DSM 11827) TaxID=1109443 RepID=G4U0V9_SERID|nr:hypothetical protein PIIN_11184 [Serendipita indica DSM 11827]